MTIIRWIFICITLFFGLHISRKLKDQDWNYHPTFLLVILAFSSLLLIVNQLIYAFSNDMQLQSDWTATIFISVWWIILAVYMLIIWIKIDIFIVVKKYFD